MKGPNDISQKKIHRKIWYLRSMSRPNFEGGATRSTWNAIWRIIFSLKLADIKNMKYMPGCLF